LTGAGFAYLFVTATNANGTSLSTPVALQWKTWTGAAPNVIATPVNLTVPAGTSLVSGTILGRVGTDTVAGATRPTSCTATGVTGITAAQSVYGYHCLITANATLAASGSGTLTVTANNGANGTSASVPIQWGTLSSSAPVVSQASFSVTTPVAPNALVGTVPATNTPTSCTLEGDPGNPIPYFSISAVASGCQININPALTSNLTGSLGSPLLYVKAANSSGNSIGNYVNVAMGLSSGPGTATAAASAATTAGMTNLIVNDTTLANAQFDTKDSKQPGYHWYGDHANFPGNYNACDMGNGRYQCDYAGFQSFFDPSAKDQDGDTPGTVILPDGNSGVLSIVSGSGQEMYSCAQFGIAPNNINLGNASIPHIAGQAYGPGFYVDIQAAFPASAIGSSGQAIALWAMPTTWIQNGWIANPSPASGGYLTEFDLMETEFGGNLNYWQYNQNVSATGFTNLYPTGSLPTDGAFHHYQGLVVPATGAVSMYIDGVLKGSTTFNSSSVYYALSNQMFCWFLAPGTTATLQVKSFQVWEHP
jgi:hypothetical protein